MQELQSKKVAVVTGSSKGIGKAIAVRLAKENYFVFATYFSDKAGGEDTIDQILKHGDEGELVYLDVTSENSVKALMEKVEKQFGYLDLLVNNAVRSVDKTIEESTYEEWKQAIEGKVNGMWLATKYAIPLLKKSGNANVILVSSNADKNVGAEVTSYGVATAGANCLMEALALYLPKYGIRVNSVMPGPVRTDNWGELKNDDNLWKNFAKNSPMGKVAIPEQIAEAMMTLINDPYKYLNGVSLFVGGGSHLK